MRRHLILVFVAVSIISSVPVRAQTDAVPNLLDDKVQIVPKRVAEALRPFNSDYLMWPEDVRTSVPRVEGSRVEAAKRDAVTWLRRVIQPLWLPPDCAPYLWPMKEDVRGYTDGRSTEVVRHDTIRTRYGIRGAVIQVTQTSYKLCLAFVPPPEFTGEEDSSAGRERYARRAIGVLVNEAARIGEVSVRTSSQGGVTVGSPDLALPGVNTNVWHDVVWWWSDGRVLAMAIPKFNDESGRPFLLGPWF